MCYQDQFKSFTVDDDNGPVFSVPHGRDNTISEEAMEGIIAEVKKHIDECDYDCDGVVVRWYDEDAMKTLGRDFKNYVNNFEIAYKFPRARQYTKLIDIKQDIGLLGKLSLTAVFEPVVFNGRTVTHASLGSYDRAKKLNLGKGDMVGIQYEIVPYLYLDEWAREHCGDSDPIKLLDTCPYCGSKLEPNPEMSCVNPDCPSRIQGKIYNFCIRAGITCIGEALVETLFQEGLVKRIEDLFHLKKYEYEFCSIDGLGQKTWKKLCNQFESLKLSEDQILSSVSIKNLGPKNSKKITNIYYIHELLLMSSGNLDKSVKSMTDKGITPYLATTVLQGVDENRELIEFLMKHVKIKKKVETKGEVVFTGFRNAKFQKYLMDEYQIAVGDSVKKTTIMVIAENPNHVTGKLKKAIDLGIPVISVPEAYEMYEFKI
jgi:DNA ligase (NAD+)